MNTKNKGIQVKRTNELWGIDLIGRFEYSKRNEFFYSNRSLHKTGRNENYQRQKSRDKMKSHKRSYHFETWKTKKMILADSGMKFDNKIVHYECASWNIKKDYALSFYHKTIEAVKRVIYTF